MQVKKLAAILLTSALFVSMVGCGKEKGIPEAAELADYEIVYPEKISGALHNPGMGWIALEEQTGTGKMDLGASGDIPEVDNIGIQTSWDMIEKSPGNYDWSLIDETIEYWTAQGKHINLRICTDSLSLPEVYFGAPRWLYEEPYNVGYQEMAYSSAVNVSRVTDITDPVYQEHFERFMQALSDKYIDNVYVDTIDVRGFGQWGEWHSGHSFADMDERMQTLDYIIDVYAEKFNAKGKTLFLSNSWDFRSYNEDGSSAATNGLCAYEDYYNWSSLDHIMYYENGSYRRDGGAGNGVVKYGTDEKLLADFFRSGKKVPMCGEFYSDYASLSNGTFGMTPVEGVDDILFKMRSNYCTAMGWANIEVANIVASSGAEVFNRGNEKMGYRLATDFARWKKFASPGEEITVTAQISNSGTGRFCLEDHHLKISLMNNGAEVAGAVNTEIDLRTVINGEPQLSYTIIQLPAALKEGKYDVVASIVDQDGNPAIRLGQEGDYDRRIYNLGKINVVGNTSAAKETFEEVSDLTAYEFKADSAYTVTFEYTPSFPLSDFRFGSNEGFVLKLGEKELMRWQDVSSETSYKTVTFIPQANGKLSLYGTGEYEGKIKAGKAYIECGKAYGETFENYDIASYESAFYPLFEGDAIMEEEGINGCSPLLTGDESHSYNDLLTSDPNVLRLKPNTAYTISFDFSATKPGGNGAYMYLALNGAESKDVFAEWYNRPDEGVLRKTYTFVVPNEEEMTLVFGMKNKGAYMIDNVQITEAASNAEILEGEDLDAVNNTIPDFTNKAFKTEGFESCNHNNSVMKYGFDRLGTLTTDKDDVIAGNVSFSSEMDPYAVPFYYGEVDCWIEFSYSNTRIISFKPNTVYNISFKYRVKEAPESIKTGQMGYFYMMFRSSSLGYGGDSMQITFGTEVTTEPYQVMSVQIATGNASDYYFVMGMYHPGVLIYDDILFEEVGELQPWTGYIDFETAGLLESNLEGSALTHRIVELASYEGDTQNEFFETCGNRFLSVDVSGSFPTIVKATSAFTGKQNTKYKISFDYYVVSTESAFIQILMRPDEGYQGDSYAELFRLAVFSGTGGHYESFLQTADKSNYRFMIEAEKGIQILIDNIVIEEV